MSAKSARFRELLGAPEPLIIPGGFSPLHARLCEAVGYDAFFMSGSQAAAYLFALADVGEDQEAPKKSGTQAGRRCISRDEAIGETTTTPSATGRTDSA